MDRRFSARMCNALRALEGMQHTAWLHVRTLEGLAKRALVSDDGRVTRSGALVASYLGKVKRADRFVVCSECGKRRNAFVIAWGVSSEERPVCITCIVKEEHAEAIVDGG